MQSAAVARAIEKEDTLLAPPTVPPPVFFCTVEPSSAADQRSEWRGGAAQTSLSLSDKYMLGLDHALQCLSQEDPSLRVTVDRDSGQVC